MGNHGRYAILKSIKQDYLQNNFIWFGHEVNKIVKFPIYPEIPANLLPDYSYFYIAYPEISNTDILNSFQVIINTEKSSYSKKHMTKD